MSSLFAFLIDLFVGASADAERRRKEQEAIRKAQIDAADKALRDELDAAEKRAKK